MLYHVDPDQIGAQARLQPEVAQAVGRTEPAFDGERLGDPTISRIQCTVCFRGGEFEVEPNAAANQATEVIEDGHPVPLTGPRAR